MTAYFPAFLCSAAFLLLVGSVTSSATPVASASPSKAQITIVYDAFGKDPAMQKDWGYAALVEYGGKRILFDTGNNPEVLAQNAKAKSIDLGSLDFVVMSHRHGDHMGGLAYLLKVNPKVKIYAPKEGFGVYGADLPSSFYRKDSSLPSEQRYYGGAPPGLDLPGPVQTSNSWTKRSRSYRMSTSSLRSPINRGHWNCTSCRWLSKRQTAWCWWWDVHIPALTRSSKRLAPSISASILSSADSTSLWRAMRTSRRS